MSLFASLVRRASWVTAFAAIAAGCGGDDTTANSGGAGGTGGAAASSSTTSSAGTGGDASSSSNAGGSGGAGVGGNVASSAASGGGDVGGGPIASAVSASSSASSASGGGSSAYSTCSDCTLESGAQANECASQKAACDANAKCVEMYDCAYNSPGCATDADGACCTLKCQEVYGGSDAAAITLFRALDGCVICETCKTICEPLAEQYCTALTTPAACP